MATLAVTNTFNSGETIVASEMNTNFNDVEAFINSSPGVLQLTGGTVTGAVIVTSTLTIGVDGTGHDVKLFGDTAGDYIEWDADTNKLIIEGTNGNTALDVSDGNVVIGDGTLTVGSDGAGEDVTFYSDTAGDSFVWDSSAEKLTITGTNAQTALDVADGNVTVADTVTAGAFSGPLTGNVTGNTSGQAGTLAGNVDGTKSIAAGGIQVQESFTISNGNINTATGEWIKIHGEVGEIEFAIGNAVKMSVNSSGQVTATTFNGTASTATNVTATANNSTDETVYPTFVDGATGSQGIETDTGLTYNPSSGNLSIGGELVAASLDISGNIDVDGTTNLDVVDIDGAVDMASTLTIAAGSAGTPTIHFSGDTDTGIYRNGANILGFVAEGAVRQTIHPAGTVLNTCAAGTGTDIEINGLGVLVQNSSSLRYKNVASVNMADHLTANMIDSLEPKMFSFKSDSDNHPMVGLIAEDCHTVSPFLAVHNQDGESETTDKNALISLLIIALKDARARITTLEG